MQGVFIFEKTKESKFLTHCSQKKNRMILSKVVLKLEYRKDREE